MGTLIGALVRLIISALSLLLVEALITGFTLGGFWNAVLVALVIAVLGYIVEAVVKLDQAQMRGVVGFIVSVVVIYLAQFVVTDFTVTVLGALLAAIIIGIIDMFVPTFKLGEKTGQ